MFGALNMTGSPNILSLLIFFFSFFFFFPSRNRQRKLGTKVQWSTKFICETEFRTTHVHTDTFPFTDANKCSLNPSLPPTKKWQKSKHKNDTGEPSSGLTWLQRSKGQKKQTQKKIFTGGRSAWTWPGAYSLSKSVPTPLLLVQLA